MSERRVRDLIGDVGELIATREGASVSYDEYRADPVGFIRDVLGADPWAKQVEIAEAVRDHAQVTVRSCHAAGKDWLSARLALWWVYARRGRVILTGPTQTQVEEILMRGEVNTAWHGAGLPGALGVQALRTLGNDRAGILAKTGTGVSSRTGFHADEVLYIITEAQDPDINAAWDAAVSVATGAEDRLLTVGNPTEPAGHFYRAHQPGSGWRAFKITAQDIPNVQEGRTVVPGLLDVAGVKRIERHGGGRESPFAVSRLDAEFPVDGTEDALVQSSWLDRAHELHESRALLGPTVTLGLDPARLGPDASALCVRAGFHVHEVKLWRGADTMMTADRIVSEVRQLMREGRDVDGVWVDEVGLGGGILDRLKELLPQLAGEAFPPRMQTYEIGDTPPSPHRHPPPAHGFDAGKAASDPDRFLNARAEAYWGLRKLLEEGKLALPPSDDLDEELLRTKVKFTSRGLVQIEAKDDLKKRIGRSPDAADALVISLAPVVYRPRKIARLIA